MHKILLSSLFLWFTTGAMAKTVIPVLTDSSYPPYSYVEKGELKGIYIDIVKQLNATMKDFEIQLTGLGWRDAKSKVKDGEFPALLGAYYHGHDWEYLYPYSQPLLYENVVLACHKERVSEVGLLWPEDFKDKLVSHISGYDGWLHDNVRDKKVTDLVNFIEVPDIDTGWRMVNKKIVDCTLFEKRALEALQKQLSDGCDIIDASQVTHESVHIGFSKHPQVKEQWPKIKAFRKQLDNAIYLSKKQINEAIKP